MANYKLTPNQRDLVRSAVETLCLRRISLARQNFPMTAEQIKNAIVPPRCRELIAELRTFKADSLQQTQVVCCTTPKDMVGIQRRAGLRITLPKGIDYIRNNNKYSDGWRLETGIDLDLSELSEEERAAFAKWVNGVVREERLKNLAMLTVYGFVVNCELPLSTYGIMARWPELGGAIQDYDPRTWRERFSDIPKSTAMNRWKWNSDWSDPSDDRWWAANKKNLDATSVIITGALMLPPMPAVVVGAIDATVQVWEKLEGDAI